MKFFENLISRLTHTEKFDLDTRNIHKYEVLPEDYKRILTNRYKKENDRLDRKDKLDKLKGL